MLHKVEARDSYRSYTTRAQHCVHRYERDTILKCGKGRCMNWSLMKTLSPSNFGLNWIVWGLDKEKINPYPSLNRNISCAPRSAAGAWQSRNCPFVSNCNCATIHYCFHSSIIFSAVLTVFPQKRWPPPWCWATRTLLLGFFFLKENKVRIHFCILWISNTFANRMLNAHALNSSARKGIFSITIWNS